MKKMAKAAAALLSLLMVGTNVVALSSCNKKGGGLTDNVEVVAYDGSEVTVQFYHTMGANLRGVLDKYIPKFNEMYPNIKIEHGTKGDYPGLRDQISTELTGGNAPSIAYCYPDHVALYNSAKAVLPLDDFIASTLEVTKADGTKDIMGLTETQIKDYVTAYYEEGRAYGDNVMYTLPFSKSTEVLYYNKTEFAKNGWTVPTTWDEMEALCKTIKETFPNDVPLGYDSEANWFITMCEQLGSDYTSAKEGEHFLFNNETNWKFVEKLKGWYDKGYVTTEEIYGGYTSDLFTELGTDEKTGKAKPRSYMCIGSSAGASYQCPDPLDGDAADKQYPFEVGVALIPQMDVANPKVISQGPSICLFKKSNPQEVAAAWLFAKYFTTCIEFQADFSMTSGYAPVIQSVETDEIYNDFLNTADGNGNLQATCVKQCIAQKNALYVSPAFNGSSEARDQVGVLLQDVFINKNKEDTSTPEKLRAFVKKHFDSAIEELEYFYGE
ncbi:MAG: extracellular solute-binding protein [Clostridia bacterium]|nr:extracellular solute-binding protein [Clostridia bacterium]